VLGDVVAVARNRVPAAGPGESTYADLRGAAHRDPVTRYHISLDVADRPGVLAAGRPGLRRARRLIETVRQDGHGDDAELVVVTHTATGRAPRRPSPRCGLDACASSSRHAGRGEARA
jgi:homoserine dehydrogenase